MESHFDKIKTFLHKNTGPGVLNFSRLTTHIFLSTIKTAHSAKVLNVKKVRTLIYFGNKLDFKKEAKLKKHNIKIYKIPLSNIDSEHIIKGLESCIHILSSCLARKQNIVLTCDTGYSISPSIFLAFFLTRQYTLKIQKTQSIKILNNLKSPNFSILLDLIKFIKEIRPSVEPRDAFIHQLLEYELFLKKTYTPQINSLIKKRKKELKNEKIIKTETN